MRFANKIVKYWIKNISENIDTVFFKHGTRNVHHKKKQNDICCAVAMTTVSIIQEHIKVLFKGLCNHSTFTSENDLFFLMWNVWRCHVYAWKLTWYFTGVNIFIKRSVLSLSKTCFLSQQSEAAEFVYGQLIWGRLKGYDWWPGRVVSYNEAQKAPPSPSTHWVKWFGDNKLSMVCKIKIFIL